MTFSTTREFIGYAGKYISGKMLDLGAGRGKYKNELKKNAAEYVAFDMVEGDNIDVVGDAENLPFADETFNTIVCTQVLEHVARPWLVASQISRVLKVGGICVITAPFINPFHSDPNDYYRYTPEGLKSLLPKEEFEIIESGGYGRLFTVLYTFINLTVFSPYKKPIRFTWTLNRFLGKSAKFLDRFVSCRSIYDSSYVIAKKL